MNPLKELREKMTARARGASGLAGAYIYGLFERDSREKIESELRKMGSVVYIFPPLPVEVNANLPEIAVDVLECRVRCLEAPTTSGAVGGPDLYTMATEVLGLYHNWDARMEHVGRLFAPQRPIREVSADKLHIWDILFTTEAILPLKL